MVKNLPASWETQAPSLGQEDPLEKGMVTYSSILAWRIPWTQEPDWLYSRGRKELDMTEATLSLSHTHTHTQYSAGFPKEARSGELPYRTISQCVHWKHGPT